jgi:hypothetical protein
MAWTIQSAKSWTKDVRIIKICVFKYGLFILLGASACKMKSEDAAHRNIEESPPPSEFVASPSEDRSMAEDSDEIDKRQAEPQKKPSTVHNMSSITCPYCCDKKQCCCRVFADVCPPSPVDVVECYPQDCKNTSSCTLGQCGKAAKNIFELPECNKL